MAAVLILAAAAAGSQACAEATDCEDAETQAACSEAEPNTMAGECAWVEVVRANAQAKCRRRSFRCLELSGANAGCNYSCHSVVGQAFVQKVGNGSEVFTVEGICGPKPTVGDWVSCRDVDHEGCRCACLP